MGLSTYSMMMKGTPQEYLFQFKKQVVKSAQAEGIKPAMRRWGLGRNTIRRWLRNFEAEGNKGLYDKRKGPNHIPHKISPELEKKIIQARHEVPCYGPRRLKYFFNIECSLDAIYRVLKQNGLTVKRRKKYQKKNDLREAKAKYQAFGHMQMDLKYLRDIPNYWGQLKPLKLPRFQYTVRDTKSGMLFLGFSDELSELNARTMIDYVLRRLRSQMPDKKIIVQTDNGVEFGGTTRHFEKSPFCQAVQAHGGEHLFIPPKLCNANGDVESLHNLIETEFFDIAKFESREDFIRKAESYRLFFNLERPNSYKGGKTPWLIAQQDWADNDLASYAAIIETVDLDKMTISGYSKRGPGLPNSPAKSDKIITYERDYFKNSP